MIISREYNCLEKNECEQSQQIEWSWEMVSTPIPNEFKNYVSATRSHVRTLNESIRTLS